MNNKLMKHPRVGPTFLSDIQGRGCFISEAYFINMILRVVVNSSADILTK
jgi:hypothetical protein